MEYDRNDLAWAGGLFEGEGSISIHHYGGGLEYPQMVMAMTDEDVVRHFHAVMGFGSVTVRQPQADGLGKLPLWIWRANSFEHGQATVALLWPYLGQRRRARATEVLAAVKESQVHRKTMRRGKECSVDGCSKPVWANGFCGAHNQQDYVAKHGKPLCSVKGCKSQARKGGRCRTHAKEKIDV